MTDHRSPIELLTFGSDADHWKSIIDNLGLDLNVASSPNKNTLPEHLTNVRCLVGLKFPDKLLDQLPNLEWIQCLSVGVEEWVKHPRISPEVTITNTGGLNGDAVAEYVSWAMLTLFRRYHTAMENQRKRRWKQVVGSSLAGKTIAVVGIGDVGSKVLRQAKAMNMATIGVVRNHKAALAYDNVDQIVPVDQLHEHVAAVDALVLCLPPTQSSVGMVNRELIEKMKRSAIIVNASRAELIDGRVVMDAVANGRLYGAAVDVFDKEPLRRWSRAWNTRNLLITPHIAALTSDYKTRVADFLQGNMIRFSEGRPLLNIVDRSKGY